MDDDVQPAVSRPAHGRSSKQEKVCHNCGTTRTPLWRKEGGSHLCNACGIYLKARGTHRPVELIRAQMILSARRGTGPDGGTGNDGGGGGSRARAVANQITRKSARKRTLRPGEGADDDDNYVSAKTARVATHARRPHLPPHASDAASTLMRNRLLAYSLAMGYTGNGGGATVGGGAGGHGPMLMPLHGTALAADGGLHGGAGHRGFGGGGAGGNGGLARLHALHAAQQRFNAGGGMFGGGGGFAGALAEEHNAALARYYGGGDGGEVGDGGDGSQDDEFMAYNGEGLQRGLYAGDGLPGGYGSGQTEEDEEEEEEEEDALIDGSVGGVDGMNPELSTCPELKADDDACAVASFLLMMRAGPSRGRKAAANAAAPQQQLVPLQLVPQREDAAVHQSLEAAVAAAQRAAGGMQLGGEHEDGSLPTDLAPGTPAAAGAAEVTAVVLEGNAAPAEAAAGDAAVKVQEEQTLAKPVSESEPGQPTSSTGTARPQPLTVQPTTSSQDGPDCVRLPQLVLAAAGSESPLVQSGADGAAEELAAAAMAAAAARSDVTKASPTGSDACDENVLGSLAPAVGAAAAAAAAAGDSDEAEERPADELLATMAPVGYRARNLDPASLQVRGEPTREHVVAPLVIPPPRPQHGAAGSRDRASMQVPPALALAWYAARLRDDNGASPEPEKKRTPVKWTWALLRATFNAFDPAYWEYKVVNVLLWFARFDVALLTLRAVEVVPKELLPAMIVTNMTMQILLTPVVGKIAGGGGAKGGGSSHRNALLLLLAGLGVMVAANACFVLPGLANTWGMFAGAALLGVHMALTHANLKATSAAMMPQKEVPGLGRVDGSAASFDASLLGIALLGSNAAAGALTDMTREAGLGNVGCFCGGAVACLLAGLLLIAFCTWGHLGKWAAEKDAEAARKAARKAAEEAAAKAEGKAAEPALA